MGRVSQVRVAIALFVGTVALLSGCTRRASSVYVTSGDKVWEFSALDPKNGGPVFPPFAVGDECVTLSAPTVGTAGQHGTVYAGSSDGDLYALTAPGLALRWKYHIGDFNGVGTPAVENRTVYFTGVNGVLYALDDIGEAAGPNVKWTFKIGSNVASRPTAMNGTVYFGDANGVVYAVSVSTTDLRPFLKWSHQTVGGGVNPIESSPAIMGDTLYIGAGDRLYAFDINGSKDNVQKWSFQTGGPIFSSPAVSSWDGGTVYIGSNDGFVYAIDANKPVLKWKFKTGNSVRSSPYVVGGLLFVGSDDSNVYAITTTAPNPSLFWKFQTKSVVSSSPVAATGIMFVGGEDGNLYSLAVVPKNPPVADLFLSSQWSSGFLTPLCNTSDLLPGTR